MATKIRPTSFTIMDFITVCVTLNKTSQSATVKDHV